MILWNYVYSCVPIIQLSSTIKHNICKRNLNKRWRSFRIETALAMCKRKSLLNIRISKSSRSIYRGYAAFLLWRIVSECLFDQLVHNIGSTRCKRLFFFYLILSKNNIICIFYLLIITIDCSLDSQVIFDGWGCETYKWF